MTIQILFIQGGGAGAEDDWDSKLVASILIGVSSQVSFVYSTSLRQRVLCASFGHVTDRREFAARR